jgi:hypothetical protein
VLDEKGSIVALVHHVTDATAAILTKKTDVLTRPNPYFSETPLERADRAILQARETIRQSREALLITRAQLQKYVPSRRFKKNL